MEWQAQKMRGIGTFNQRNKIIFACRRTLWGVLAVGAKIGNGQRYPPAPLLLPIREISEIRGQESLQMSGVMSRVRHHQTIYSDRSRQMFLGGNLRLFMLSPTTSRMPIS